MRETMMRGIRICLAVLVFVTSGCSTNSQITSATTTLPENVLRELSGVRDIAKAAHDEYDRLYSSIVFPNEDMKSAAARWHKEKEFNWQMVQLNTFRARRLGLASSSLEFLIILDSLDRFVEAEPSVFVETTFSPKVTRKELASLAKLASLREDLDAARLRLVKALLAVEEAATKRD